MRMSSVGSTQICPTAISVSTVMVTTGERSLKVGALRTEACAVTVFLVIGLYRENVLR